MYKRDKNTKSFIDSFLINGKHYKHAIFCADDDRVELSDEEGNVLMTYTANCEVLDERGVQIGRWTTNQENNWVYVQGAIRLVYGKNLLKAEVEVSKLYIQGSL